MSSVDVGAYVTHAKMLELGAGEVLSMEKNAIRIRFASGERAFQGDVALAHLTVTTEAPVVLAPSKAKRVRKTAPRKK